MKNTYAIDFESTYTKDRDIKTLGTWGYVSHPETKIYLVAIYGEDVQYCGPLEGAPWERINGEIWLAHNSSFDGLVFAEAVLRGQIPSNIYPKELHCTANMSVYFGAGRALQKAVKDLLGIDVPKDVRDKMRGRDWREMQTDPEVLAYGLRDAELCYRLWEAKSDQWPEAERWISNFTVWSGWQGATVDQEKVQQGIEVLTTKMFEATKLIPWAGESPILSKKALDLQCREVGIEPPASMAEDDPRCVAWENDFSGEFPWVSAMRDWRKCNGLYKKLLTIRARTRPTDGRIETSLKYFGAHTGRWSGTGGLNWQNLPREPLYGVDLRGVLIGNLYVVDFSAIEPRCYYTMVGDEVMLNLLRKGYDVYEAYARLFLGYSDPRKLKVVDPTLRGLAKASTLALAYGTGAEKLQATSELLYGVRFTDVESRRAVADFRKKNPLITGYWRSLERALQGSCGENMELQLPSGRPLVYYGVRRRGTSWECRDGLNGNFYRIWNSKIFENIAQAVARDVLRDAIRRVTEAGYKIILQVHDEIIVDGVKTDEQAREIDRLMCEPPLWMPNLPVAVDGKRMSRYKKD